MGREGRRGSPGDGTVRLDPGESPEETGMWVLLKKRTTPIVTCQDGALVCKNDQKEYPWRDKKGVGRTTPSSLPWRGPFHETTLKETSSPLLRQMVTRPTTTGSP